VLSTKYLISTFSIFTSIAVILEGPNSGFFWNAVKASLVFSMNNLSILITDKSFPATAISLVDIYEPDLNKFPKFEEAKDLGQSAELLPGDAIFIPSLWWHQVESFGPLNVLINYLWRDVPSYMGNPMDALMHSILSVRDLPDHQKENWINMFKHYVFNYENKNFDHIPEDIHGAVGNIDDNLAKKIRALLLNNLNR